MSRNGEFSRMKRNYLRLCEACARATTPEVAEKLEKRRDNLGERLERVLKARETAAKRNEQPQLAPPALPVL